MLSASSLGIPLAKVPVEGLGIVLSLLDIEPDTLLLVAHPSRLRTFLCATRFPPFSVSPSYTYVTVENCCLSSIHECGLRTQAAPSFTI